MRHQLSKNGFPAPVGSVFNVISLVVDIGQQLKQKQADVVAVYKGQMSANENVWVKTKPDGSSVTSSDIWSHHVLTAQLAQLPQNHKLTGIVSEEAEVAHNLIAAQKPLLWMLDSLDNTGDYKRGGVHWSVSLAFMNKGKPTGGVVYYPSQDRLYFTGDDGAAYLKQGASPVMRLHCPALGAKTVAITDDNVSTSFAALAGNNLHAGHTDRYWAILLAKKTADKAGVIGGAHIAEHGDLFYAWDVAGPAAIAQRAGAAYARRNGERLNYLVADAGHNPFEMPREGFIAGNRQALKTLNPA